MVLNLVLVACFYPLASSDRPPENYGANATTAYRVASLLANNLALVSTMTKIENHNSRQWRVYLASDTYNLR